MISVRPLERPPSTLIISDIEASAVTVLLHKLKAASIMGFEQVLLFKYLMGGMSIEGRDDVYVAVPKSFNLALLPHHIGPE